MSEGLAVQVEALLDRAHGEAPVMGFVARSLEELGYTSWAQRIVHSGGETHILKRYSTVLILGQSCLEPVSIKITF